MSFDVAAESYGRFMGRFSEPLAPLFLDWAGVPAGAAPVSAALDVGCGPGALTRVLVDRLGAAAVLAVDPSEPFVAAARAALPGVDVRRGTGEALPFPDDAVDVALAQLVVHFMADPIAGLREMARVTRPGGTVAASVWDHAGGLGPLAVFTAGVHDLDPTAPGESDLPGTRQGHLTELATAAGLTEVRATGLTVHLTCATFDEWWEPFTLGVGPAGDYVAGLDAESRERLRAHLADVVGPAPFTIDATAWCVAGTVSSDRGPS